MSDLEYSHGDRLFRADETVIEIFGRSVDGSKRYPLAWLGVQIETRKGDEIRLKVGLAPAGASFWTDRILSTGPLAQVDLPAGEEPGVRAFFDELARRSGRG